MSTQLLFPIVGIAFCCGALFFISKFWPKPRYVDSNISVDYKNDEALDDDEDVIEHVIQIYGKLLEEGKIDKQGHDEMIRLVRENGPDYVLSLLD